ncbi:MAG TPA: restriction endonuclease subunit S [Desulfuromonadales bacterium]|nr:restriction endonuclease subunit S [Desulfuromonadales bacterium]
MSRLNFMEKLLDGVEVEWKALEQVAKIKHGKDWKGLETGNVPVYGSGGIMGYVDTYSYDKPSVLIPRKGSITNIFYVESSFWNVDTIYYTEIDESKIIPKFLYHFIKTIDLMALDTGSGRPSLTQAILNKILIPIPCPENPEKSLEIQSEIVRILDTFTELTAELTARKKQYAYYRDQLLSFEDGTTKDTKSTKRFEVEWKTLGDMAFEFGRGKSKHRPRNDQKLYGGSIPFIQTGDIRNASHVITEYTQTYSDFGLSQSKLWPKGTLCITIAANIAETTILGFDSCFPDSVIGFIANPEKTTSNYVEYLLSSFKSKLQSQSTGSAQDNINMGTFESMRFPFPPLAEQARIFAILDKFDALTISVTEGLPREIELRQKQYEYYRNLLLSSPKPETIQTRTVS